MARTQTATSSTNSARKSLAEFLAVADRQGTIDIVSEGKIYRLTLVKDTTKSVQVGSPFDNIEPVEVNMTREEFQDMFAKMRGD
ncbi:MAG: hypothetical protein AABY68_13840 [Pseudomonadota bacterium]